MGAIDALFGSPQRSLVSFLRIFFAGLDSARNSDEDMKLPGSFDLGDTPPDLPGPFHYGSFLSYQGWPAVSFDPSCCVLAHADAIIQELSEDRFWAERDRCPSGDSVDDDDAVVDRSKAEALEERQLRVSLRKIRLRPGGAEAWWRNLALGAYLQKYAEVADSHTLGAMWDSEEDSDEDAGSY